MEACDVSQVPSEFQQVYIDLTHRLGEAAIRLHQAERNYQAVLLERITFVERVRYGNPA